MLHKLMFLQKSAAVLIIFSISLVLIYWQPWEILTNHGSIYVLFCEPIYESKSVWEYQEKNKNLSNEKQCSTSQLSVIKLNYKVFVNKQKVVFTGNEIGILSYECDVYDRLNFACPDKDISMEKGEALLSFNSHETVVSRWRYLLIKMNLFLDIQFNRENVYRVH